MIDFIRYKLDNGLTVILHNDDSSPLVAVNVLYKVGSRNEHLDKTGFAHLFEHLMFGGSENVADFDSHVQRAGGDSNAFTNSDITNFYTVLPAENLETSLWLEADRMLALDINKKSLEVQQKVVVEEFKETCINKPYGDLWHELSSLTFTEHPYRWPTIGLVPDHIEKAKLEDVKSFFENYYGPDNAILTLTGRLDIPRTKQLIEKWFGSIPSRDVRFGEIKKEPVQLKFREKECFKSVPGDALYLAFKMPGRRHEDFIVYDIMSDLLGGGRSSRLYQNLLKGTQQFSGIDAYITGTYDPGLFIIESRLMEGTSPKEATRSIWKELEKFKNEKIDPEELQRVKNALFSSVVFSEVSISHKAINLAYYEMLGNVDLINTQEEEIESVTIESLHTLAQKLFTKDNCSQLNYLKA